MMAFLANAGKLADHFHCLVLIVHHVGLANDRRMRGHSSLGGGVDAQILCAGQEGALEAAPTVVKLKDEASDKEDLTCDSIKYDEPRNDSHSRG
jgi:hypothetical protein